MKIVTLIENLVFSPGLVAENGLSLLIDTGHRQILFDTGQTDAFMTNAQKLGVDLAEVDTVVISHGLYDHIGGLGPFLEMNKKARVYLKKETFVPKYSQQQEKLSGSFDPGSMEDRFVFVTSTLEIDPGVFIMPNIPIVNKEDTDFRKCRIKAGDLLVEDTFEDELFLAIVKDQKLSVISSCSHRGITNMIIEATKHFDELPVNLVLGGINIREGSSLQYVEVSHFLKKVAPETIGVCHCYSIEKYADLLYDVNSKVKYNHTGNTIEL